MKPTREQELAVLQSVIYASLFEYPLTLEQLHATLVGVRASKESVASWWLKSDLLQSAVEHHDGWYFPAGRGDLVATRARREALSRELLDRDRQILSLVAGMPFVRMVALSGSLAHLNAEGSADLDLFVITAPNRVWSVTVSGGRAVEGARLAQASLHELRRVRKAMAIAPPGSVLGEPDHSPASGCRARGVRSLPCRECIRARSSIRTSNWHASFPSPKPQAPSPFGSAALARTRAIRRADGATAGRLALAAPFDEVAIARSGEARAGVPEAPHQQPSRVDDGAVRARDA